MEKDKIQEKINRTLEKPGNIGSNSVNSKVFTIPNILTTFRIVLIPVFMFFYLTGPEKNYIVVIIIAAVSFLTDLLDGIIARSFNMVSDLGKALDPIADKLSQASLLGCLCYRFPNLLYLLIFLAVKELVSGLFLLKAMNLTGEVYSAKWHGKLTTGCISVTMLTHLLWPKIPPNISDIMLIVTACMMAISFALYLTQHIRNIRAAKKGLKNE